VRFIFEPDRTSPNGITYSWLIHDAYSGKEKAATATRAFWLPFPYRHSGNYSEAELRDLAQQSIWQMEAQIQHLHEEFDLGMARSRSTEVVGTFDAEKLPAEARHCTSTACDRFSSGG
jgi:primosomal replication protein N